MFTDLILRSNDFPGWLDCWGIQVSFRYIPFMIFCFAADSFEQVDFDALRRELAEYLWRRVVWCFCWEVWKNLSDSIAINGFNLPLGLLALH